MYYFVRKSNTMINLVTYPYFDSLELYNELDYDPLLKIDNGTAIKILNSLVEATPEQLGELRNYI